MSRTSQNFSMFSGTSKVLQLNLFDADGVPLDLTDVTLEWGAAPSRVSDAVLEKSSTDVGQIKIADDPTTGIAYVYLQPDDTAEWAAKQYHHEARSIDGDGGIEVLLTGAMIVELSILD